MTFSNQYWDELYFSNKTGWDTGGVSTPLKEYFDQLANKDMKILVPGAGKAWEAEYLYKQGFHNTFILDFSKEAISEFKLRCPWFPDNQIYNQDFFSHNNTYDLIVEQTFFSSLLPAQRVDYACSIHKKLNIDGSLVGLLFNHEFEFEGPPFGGSKDEYVSLFKKYFKFEIFETAYNSIKPRRGREFFVLFKRNSI